LAAKLPEIIFEAVRVGKAQIHSEYFGKTFHNQTLWAVVVLAETSLLVEKAAYSIAFLF